MRPLRAGKYRHKVYVQQKGQVRNSDGQWVTDWVDVKHKFMDKVPLQTEDYFVAKQSNAVSTVTWRTRYDPTIDGSMRLVEKNSSGQIKNAYEIVGDPIDREGLNRELEIITEVVNANG